MTHSFHQQEIEPAVSCHESSILSIAFLVSLICSEFGWCYCLLACLHTAIPKIVQMPCSSLVILLLVYKGLTTNLTFQKLLFYLPLCVCYRYAVFLGKELLYMVWIILVFYVAPLSLSHDCASFEYKVVKRTRPGLLYNQIRYLQAEDDLFALLTICNICLFFKYHT